MIKHFRYSSTIKPFINVRGLNVYPAPDYLLSEVALFEAEADLIEGLVIEYKKSEEDEYAQTFPAPVNEEIAKPAKPAKVEKTVEPKVEPKPDPVSSDADADKEKEGDAE